MNGLEERVLLASYVVMNTELSGTGSLAEAIGLANASPGEDVISFDTSYFSVDQVIDYAPSIEYLPAISDTSGGKLRIQGPTSSKLTIRFNDCAEIYTKSPCEISYLYLEARTTGDLSNDYLYRKTANYDGNGYYYTYMYCAIYNKSDLTLTNVSINSVLSVTWETSASWANYAYKAFATGILNTNTGNLLLKNSRITNFSSYSTSTYDPIGCGLWNEGVANVVDVTIGGCDSYGSLAESIGTGASIINSKTLTVERSTLDWSGNGLINYGAAIVGNSSFTRNSKGLDNKGQLTLNYCEISGSKYGAVVNDTSGVLTINQSSIWNNTALKDGLALNNKSSQGVSLINCTIANNNSANYAAILNDTNARMSITSSTISGNSAGIKALSSVLISDSLISNTGYDVSGSVDSVSGYNLVANGTGLTGIANGTNGNRIGTSSSKVDAKLQPLNYYGGSTKSVALQALSPAIDAGGTQVSLTSAISNSVTSFAMTNASLLGCTSGLMNPVQVDNEIMMVIAVSLTNNTVTVIRGSSGTQAATHLSGAKVYLLNDQRGISRLNTPDIGAFESQKYILSIASGDNQSQTVNKSMPSAFKVKVTDPKGIAVSGVQVSFNAPAIGAGCSFPTSNLAVSDSTGLATSQVAIANTKAGSYSLTASIPDIGFVTFYESSVADSFAMVQPYIGDNNSYTVNRMYYYNLIAARSTDQFGNPVPKIPIWFNNPNTSGANCTFANTSSVISDNYGIAYSPNITTNTIAGNYKVTATSGIAIPANFTLTNIADSPSNMTLISGGDQITPIGTAFSKPIVIGLTDKYNNKSYLSGVKIIFEVPANGPTASFSHGYAYTDSNGTATFQPVIANKETGFYKINIYADPNVYPWPRPWVLTTLGNSLGSPITVINSNDSGAGSLRDAINIANADPGEDQIVFTGSAFSSNATITLGSTLVLEGDTKIYGPSASRLTISGDNKCTVLVNRGVSEISNLTITSGNSSNSTYYSGGIDNYLDLALNNMTLNYCNGYYGGAIYSGSEYKAHTRRTLSIVNCRFLNNTGMYGGAIYNVGYWDRSDLYVSDSIFDKNQAGAGGAIFFSAGEWSHNSYPKMFSGKMHLSNTTFSNSVATGQQYYGAAGGSIFIQATSGITESIISNCTISGSKANKGGAIYNYTYNYQGYAGFYYTAVSALTISDSKFLLNNATEAGGQIWNAADYGDLSANVSISNSTFVGGESFSGGAIYSTTLSNDSKTNLDIRSSSFINNSATSNGGVITNLNNSTVNISKSTFAYNNSANGGVFYNDASNSNYTPVINLNSATVAFNSASHGGGLMSMAGNINVFNSIIANNTSSDGPDVKGNIATVNFSLIGDPSQANILKGSQNIFGNPKLGNLGFYGGPTQTLPLLPGSPAINSGSPSVIGTNDQRGILYATADMGSFARQRFGSVTTLAGATSSVFGNKATFTAYVTASLPQSIVPTGKVQFFDGTTLMGAGALDANGSATYSTDLLNLGRHNIIATYQGDSYFSNSTTYRMPIDFINLGVLQNDITSEATGVSDDGNIVVGLSGDSGFIWNLANGISSIGSSIRTSLVAMPAISLNSSCYAAVLDQKLYRFANNGSESDLISEFIPGWFSGFSGDGNKLIGSTNGIAFKWDVLNGFQALPMGGDYAVASGSNYDGSLITGWYFPKTTNTISYVKAFLWTEKGGDKTIGTLPGGLWSRAYDVSQNGKVVVGVSDTSSGSEHAFVWSESNGFLDIGALGGQEKSHAWSISPDTSVVVGTSWTGSDYYSGFNKNIFTWDSSYGMRSLFDLLQNRGSDTNGWSSLSDAWQISGDPSRGYNIVGKGIYQGQERAFLVKGYLPSTDSTALAFTVTKQTSFAVLSSSQTTTTYGTNVNLTTVVSTDSGTTVPTGNVEFYDGTILIATSALNSSGVAVYSTDKSAAGSHTFSSRYLGDLTFGNSNSTSNSNLTVKQAPLSVTINDKTKLYGSNMPVLTYSYSGLVAGDTASVFTGSIITTAKTNSAVGSYPITGGTPWNGLWAGPNYTITFTNGTLNVIPASLSVTASSFSKTYGASLPGLYYTYSGLVNGDKVSVLSGLLSTTATASSAVGNYPITQGSLKAGNNYTIAFTNGTLTITPTTLQVTGSNTTKAYGANLPVLGYTYSGLVNGDSSSLFSGSLATTATANSSVGNYPITQGTLSVGNNYSIVYSNGTLKVAPVSLAVVASNISKVFGANVPELTYSYSGLVNSDTSAIFTGNLSTTATSNSPAADYPIVQGNLMAGSNYNISFTNGTLSVLKSGSATSISVPASSIAGASISITSSVKASSPGAGTPTGSVQFYDGSSLIGTVILDTNAQATLNTSGLVIGNHLIKSVYIGDTSFNTSTSSVATLEILTNKTIVQSFIQDASSVTVVFNNPIATTLLQINDAYSGSTLTEEADLIIKDGSNLAVKGSLIVAPDAKSATFIKTGAGFANGTYSVRIRSAVNAFRNSTGELLDGDNDGQAGGDYQTSFTVANVSRVVSIPDVVRGPGQALRVNPADLGIPIKINDTQDVYSFNVRLKYDPTLMTVTDIAVPSNLSSVLQVTYNITTAGQIDVTGVATNGLPSGTQSLFMINGKVPDKAPYRSKAELLLSNIHLYRSDKSELTTTIDQGIQLVSYIGDVTGDGRYNALDTLRIQRYLVNLDRWFAQLPLVDPLLVADVTGDGKVNALDALYMQRYLVNLPVPYLSAPPVTSVTQSGLDPIIRLPKNLSAKRGQVVQVPVELQNTDSQAINVNSFEVAVQIDPQAFRLMKIKSSDKIRTHYDDVRGILIIAGILPEFTLQPGESMIICSLQIKISAHTKVTDYVLNLLEDATIGRAHYATSVNGGTLKLVPAPTNESNDSVDGNIRILERPNRFVSGEVVRKYPVLKRPRFGFIAR